MVYLDISDLAPSYYWVGSTLAFSYRIDPIKLRQALQQLQKNWPILNGRLLQNPDGRYYIGSAAQAVDIPYQNTERLEQRLSDLPSQYSETKVSDVQPSNSLLPDFIPQLQPHLMLAGKGAFFKVQLTQVQDGCVLGFSFSHGLTDFEGIGYALADLACLYQGKAMPPKSQDGRRWLALASMTGADMLSSTNETDDEVLAKLPTFGPPPQTWEDCVATGKYDLLSCSAEARAAGEYHSAPVLHVPSVCIEKLRSQILIGQAVQEGVTTVSANDIMCGILWLIREIANGNNLEKGLQKCFLNAVDLRKHGAAADVIPKQHFGNAVGGAFSMPPDMSTASRTDTAAGSTAQQLTGQSQASLGRHYMNTLAAAACAVRKGLEALRADPDVVQTLAASYMQYMQPEKVHELLASPDFVPARDAALWVSSWRHMAIDDVDFGGGKPRFKLGCLMPACTRAVNVTAGPDGDGLMCIVRLPREGLAKVQQSQLLEHIAPEARLII
ncbi:MAG: hypothetical protein FRX49_08900 [Trebouxia sp. A1-2]|nr:MAG: hypothetical protein FRX49_08900 [Trebouxia sp. A1-2]